LPILTVGVFLRRISAIDIVYPEPGEMETA
jgi:hypothetical protein